MSDGCTFDSTSFGNLFVSTDEAAGTTLLFGAADPNDDKIYKSTDQGVTFPHSATPTGATIERLVHVDDVRAERRDEGLPRRAIASTGQTKSLLLYKSIDGGTTFTPMAHDRPADGRVTANSASIDIVGISPDDADTLYVKVTLEPARRRHALQDDERRRELDADPHQGRYGLVPRAQERHLVAGTQDARRVQVDERRHARGRRSRARRTSAASTENSAGEVWACTQNYGDTMVEHPLRRLRHHEVDRPRDVDRRAQVRGHPGAGRLRHRHDPSMRSRVSRCITWCCLEPQLGITSTAIDCSARQRRWRTGRRRQRRYAYAASAVAADRGAATPVPAARRHCFSACSWPSACYAVRGEPKEM